MLHISLSGEALFYIGSFPVTNTLLTTWTVMFFLSIFALFVHHQYALKHQTISKFNVALESLIGGFYALFESILGKSTKQMFPLLGTFFLFIITSNWFGLLPGVGTIGVVHQNGNSNSMHAMVSTTEVYAAEETDIDKTYESDGMYWEVGNTNVFWKASERTSLTPLFRAPTADLNTTIALALIAVIVLQIEGMKALGTFTYISKFITFKSPIAFFVGILEIISEIGKIISFAFRLFGNIFAGEVLLVVIAFLIPIIAPVPFLGLEVFVGFIQALVFTVLFVVFLSLATQHAEH